ncbi:MAG: PilX N-terminal domain-containing pilus assembly protein [Gammaproteobacteria bacterium]
MTRTPSLRAQRGLALIVAMVLLLVMTMVAVIAMRSTTLDLKMTTNTTQSRRAFQTSDGTRDSVSPVLAAHVFYHGWPNSIDGEVTESANFEIPDEITITDASKRYDMGENGTFEELAERSADIRFRDDVDDDDELDNEDVYGDIWVTRIGVQPAFGSNLVSNASDQGAGSGAANKYILFDLRAAGRALGNARAFTGSDYRALSR